LLQQQLDLFSRVVLAILDGKVLSKLTSSIRRCKALDLTLTHLMVSQVVQEAPPITLQVDILTIQKVTNTTSIHSQTLINCNLVSPNGVVNLQHSRKLKSSLRRNLQHQNHLERRNKKRKDNNPQALHLHHLRKNFSLRSQRSLLKIRNKK
jgi:hypothetical protein